MALVGYLIGTPEPQIRSGNDRSGFPQLIVIAERGFCLRLILLLIQLAAQVGIISPGCLAQEPNPVRLFKRGKYIGV